MLAQKALPQRSQSLPDGDEGVAALGGTEVNGVSPTYKGSLICPLQRQINQLFFTKRKQKKIVLAGRPEAPRMFARRLKAAFNSRRPSLIQNATSIKDN